MITPRRIILTGASGFLGRYITQHLASERLITVGRGIASTLRCNLAVESPQLPDSDLVIHAAGQAHMRPRTQEEREDFFRVNVTGTTNLLRALEGKNPAAFVYISSVSVYGASQGHLLSEEKPLDARDPYGASKAKAEAVVTEWCAARGVRHAILRLPLVVGFSPPGNLGAMIRGIRRGFYFNIDGGNVAKSMVLARNVAAVLLPASEYGGTYNLTDGVHPTFAALSRVIAARIGRPAPRNLPSSLSRLLAAFGDATDGRFPISSAILTNLTSELTFDDGLARSRLGWSPDPVLGGDWVSTPDV